MGRGAGQLRERLEFGPGRGRPQGVRCHHRANRRLCSSLSVLPPLAKPHEQALPSGCALGAQMRALAAALPWSRPPQQHATHAGANTGRAAPGSCRARAPTAPPVPSGTPGNLGTAEAPWGKRAWRAGPAAGAGRRHGVEQLRAARELWQMPCATAVARACRGVCPERRHSIARHGQQGQHESACMQAASVLSQPAPRRASPEQRLQAPPALPRPAAPGRAAVAPGRTRRPRLQTTLATPRVAPSMSLPSTHLSDPLPGGPLLGAAGSGCAAPCHPDSAAHAHMSGPPPRPASCPRGSCCCPPQRPQLAGAQAVQGVRLHGKRRVGGGRAGEGQVKRILALAGGGDGHRQGQQPLGGLPQTSNDSYNASDRGTTSLSGPPGVPAAALVLKAPCCRALRAPLLTAGYAAGMQQGGPGRRVVHWLASELLCRLTAGRQGGWAVIETLCGS